VKRAGRGSKSASGVTHPTRDSRIVFRDLPR